LMTPSKLVKRKYTGRYTTTRVCCAVYIHKRELFRIW
jgi:hypothetical protein